MIRASAVHSSVVLWFFAALQCFAADVESDGVQRRLVASWLVSVQGEPRTRTLNVRSIEPKGERIWALDATYGWTGGRLQAVKAEVSTVPGGYRLQIVTPADSTITVESADSKGFEGTFTPKSSKSRRVSIALATADTPRSDPPAPKAQDNARATWKCEANGLADSQYDGSGNAYVRLSRYGRGSYYSVTLNSDRTEASGVTGDGTPFKCVVLRK